MRIYVMNELFVSLRDTELAQCYLLISQSINQSAAIL